MKSRCEISVVVPVYYNAESLEELYTRMAATMKKSGVRRWEVVFVDDGSKDHSRDVLAKLRSASPHVAVLHLLRNFGANRACMAGLAVAKGAAVAIMAADLQDPPELLEEMVARWRKGARVVLAKRESKDDPWLSKLLASAYYATYRWLVSRAMPSNGFDMFLVDRKVCDLLIQGSDKSSNLSANLIWLGHAHETISYHKRSRPHGTSRWTLAKKITYFYDSVLSYTYVPLRIMTLAGVLYVLFSILYAAAIVVQLLSGGSQPQGWASLMVSVLFSSGLILMGLGLLGEYIWRSFDVSRRQPAFVVDAEFPSKP